MRRRGVIAGLIVLIIASLAFIGLFFPPHMGGGVSSPKSNTAINNNMVVKTAAPHAVIPKVIRSPPSSIPSELHFKNTILVNSLLRTGYLSLYCHGFLGARVGVVSTFEGRMLTIAYLCTNALFIEFPGSRAYRKPLMVGIEGLGINDPSKVKILFRSSSVLLISGKYLVAVVFNSSSPIWSNYTLDLGTTVYGADVDSHGKYLVVNLGNAVKVYDLRSAKTVLWKSISGREDGSGRTVRGDPHLLHIGGKTAVLVSASNAVYAWLLNGTLLWSYNASTTKLSGTVPSMEFLGVEPSPDGRLIAVKVVKRGIGYDPFMGKVIVPGTYIHVLNASNGKLLWESGIIDEETEESPIVSWSPSGKYIAIGGSRGIIWIYTGEGRLVARYNTGTPAEVVSIAWSPSEEYIAASTSQGPVGIFILDVNGSLLWQAGYHPKSVAWLGDASVAMALTGHIVVYNLASNSSENIDIITHALKKGIVFKPIAVYWLQDGNHAVVLEYANYTVIPVEYDFTGNITWIYPDRLRAFPLETVSTTMNGDDRYLAIAGAWGGGLAQPKRFATLKVIDVVSRKVVLSDKVPLMHGYKPYIAWSLNGRYLALLAFNVNGYQLKIYDVIERKQVLFIRPLPPPDPASRILAPVVTPDGRRVAYIVQSFSPDTYNALIIFDAKSNDYVKKSLEAKIVDAELAWLSPSELLVVYSTGAHYMVYVAVIKSTGGIVLTRIGEIRAGHIALKSTEPGRAFMLGVSFNTDKKRIIVDTYTVSRTERGYEVRKTHSIALSYSSYVEHGYAPSRLLDVVTSHDHRYAFISVCFTKYSAGGVPKPTHPVLTYLLNFENNSGELYSLSFFTSKYTCNPIVDIDISLDDSRIAYRGPSFLAFDTAIKARKLADKFSEPITKIFWSGNGSFLGITTTKGLYVYKDVGEKYEFLWGVRFGEPVYPAGVIRDKIALDAGDKLLVYNTNGKLLGSTRSVGGKFCWSPSGKYFLLDHVIYDYLGNRILSIKLKYNEAVWGCYWASGDKLFLVIRGSKNSYLLSLDMSNANTEKIPLNPPEPLLGGNAPVIVLGNYAFIGLPLRSGKSLIVKYDLARHEYASKTSVPGIVWYMTVDSTKKYLVIRSSVNGTEYLLVYSTKLGEKPLHSIVFNSIISHPIWVSGTGRFIIYGDRVLMLACPTSSNLTIKPITFPYKVLDATVNTKRGLVAVLVGTEEVTTNRTIYMLKLSAFK